jgi:hypothetical protein
LGQSDLLADGGRGQPGVLLQQPKDLHVCFVKRYILHILSTILIFIELYIPGRLSARSESQALFPEVALYLMGTTGASAPAMDTRKSPLK